MKQSYPTLEPSHDFNNQTVSYTDVFMAEWSEHKTENLRRAQGGGLGLGLTHAALVQLTSWFIFPWTPIINSAHKYTKS